MKPCYAIRLAPTKLAVLDALPLLGSGPGGLWLITRIYVPRGYRGRGYGSELLRQILEDAEAEDVVLALEVASYGDLGNEALLEWYARNGFEADGRLDGYLLRGPEPQRQEYILELAT